MKMFQNFDLNDPVHVLLLGHAYELSANAGNSQLGINYLKERYEAAPLKAHEALCKQALGYPVTQTQQQTIDAYFKAAQQVNSQFNELHDYPGRDDNYPDDFDPALYHLE